jgi:hypothetical protein
VNGKTIRVWIRNTSERTPQRLDKVSKVLTTLETIQREMKENCFDVRHYDSAVSAQKYIFKNYVENQYLKDYEPKVASGEVTAKFLKDKMSIIRVHLLPRFGSMALKDITNTEIKRFQREYNTTRIQQLAQAELRCILKQAVRDDMLNKSPEFQNIPRSKKRENVMTLEIARKTIEKVKGKAYQDLLTLMTIYPLRPSEMRAIRWMDVTENHLYVRGHFSGNIWLKGRKSIKEGHKSELKYPLTLEAKKIFQDHKTNLLSISRGEDFVFKGANGPFIKKEALCHAWRVARGSLGEDSHEHELYEIRHRCLTEYGKRSEGNIIKMMKFSGHTNAETLLGRYIRDEEEIEL